MLAVVLALAVARPALAQTSPAEALRAFAEQAEDGEHLVAGATPDQLRAAYDELHEAWEAIEGGVRASDPAGYVALEGALDELKDAVSAQQIDVAAVEAAFAEVEHTALAVAAGPAAPADGAATPTTMAGFRAELDAAYAAAERGEAAEARDHLGAAVRAWPAVEGEVAAKDPAAYSAIEVDLGKAVAALAATPPDLAAAGPALDRMRDATSPFAQGAAAYGIFDAAAILLREGLEALLVIVALLAFLRRTGHADKGAWIWGGVAAGVAASVAAGFALQALFSAAAAGQSREIVEGLTGLAAAAMLFYVAYWLHSKSSLSAWRAFIDKRTGQALASGSLLSLSVLAFLAMFREGAETVVFYLGIAPSISMRDLLLGFGLGALVLAVVAVLMLGFSVKLPLRLFFRVASLLVYYLGFKFVGTGIHALQVAGTLPSSQAPVPAVPFFGVYPTWETLLPQLLLLALGLAALVFLSLRDRRALATARA